MYAQAAKQNTAAIFAMNFHCLRLNKNALFPSK
jgi:hypothetical protein